MTFYTLIGGRPAVAAEEVHPRRNGPSFNGAESVQRALDGAAGSRKDIYSLDFQLEISFTHTHHLCNRFAGRKCCGRRKQLASRKRRTSVRSNPSGSCKFLIADFVFWHRVFNYRENFFSFSNLFSATGSEREHPAGTGMMRTSQTVPSLQFHVQSGKVGPGSPVRVPNDPNRANNRRKADGLAGDSGSGGGVKAHVRRQDGRLQAYGWSLPSRQPSPAAAISAVPNPNTPSKSGGAAAAAVAAAAATVGVPVPVYCRPLEDQEPGMKVR